MKSIPRTGTRLVVAALAAVAGCGGPSVESTGSVDGTPVALQEAVWDSTADGASVLLAFGSAPHLCALARDNQSARNQQVLVVVAAWWQHADGRAMLSITAPSVSGPLAPDTARAEYRLTDDACNARIQREAASGTASLRGASADTISGTVDVGFPNGDAFSVKFDRAPRCWLGSSEAIRFSGLFPGCI